SLGAGLQRRAHLRRLRLRPGQLRLRLRLVGVEPDRRIGMDPARDPRDLRAVGAPLDPPGIPSLSRSPRSDNRGDCPMSFALLLLLLLFVLALGVPIAYAIGGIAVLGNQWFGATSFGRLAETQFSSI